MFFMWPSDAYLVIIAMRIYFITIHGGVVRFMRIDFMRFFM